MLRILCIAAYRSNHADRHLTLLARSGFRVHLAEMNAHVPAREALDGVEVHAFRYDEAKASQWRAAAPVLSRLRRTLRFPGSSSLYGKGPPEADESLLLRLAARSLLSDQEDRAEVAARWLAELMDRLQPDVLHSFAIHQASFLTWLARRRARRARAPWIVSNWGCDIHYFGLFPHLRDEYAPAIRTTLRDAQGYFAETWRDDGLAREFGFRGTTLAIAPIGGGFALERYRALRSAEPASRRRLIMVKGYQGHPARYSVGRALTAMQALHDVAPLLHRYEVHLYAATHPEVLSSAARLRSEHGISVTVHPFLDYDDLMRLHGRARCSIGMSETDGISTSAIEAMLMGSVPVQADSSGLSEWIAPHGACIVPLNDPIALASMLMRVLTDDAFVDAASRSNDDSLRARFGQDVVDPQIVRMYRDAASLR